jgi:hypothetical protein
MAVAQVEERQAAEISDAMHPAEQHDGRANIGATQLAAGVGAISRHKRP